MRDEVYVDCGNGGYPVSAWEDLWDAMWEAVAWAIAFEAAGGRCAHCGCEDRECAYCAHECC